MINDEGQVIKPGNKSTPWGNAIRGVVILISIAMSKILFIFFPLRNTFAIAITLATSRMRGITEYSKINCSVSQALCDFFSFQNIEAVEFVPFGFGFFRF